MLDRVDSSVARTGAAPTASDPRDTDPELKSTAAQIGVAFGIFGGAIKGAVDAGRVAAAFPKSRREGHVALWATQLLTVKPTAAIVPLEGGRWNLWHTSNSLSKATGVALVLSGLAVAAAPNLLDGVNRGGGPSGLVTTRSGRTGLVQTTSSLLGIGLLVNSARAGAGHGVLGMWNAAVRSPLQNSFKLVALGYAWAAATVYNELGGFDFANKGSTESPLDSAGVVVHNVADFAAGLIGMKHAEVPAQAP
jgi:hypothetical protein